MKVPRLGGWDYPRSSSWAWSCISFKVTVIQHICRISLSLSDAVLDFFVQHEKKVSFSKWSFDKLAATTYLLLLDFIAHSFVVLCPRCTHIILSPSPSISHDTHALFSTHFLYITFHLMVHNNCISYTCVRSPVCLTDKTFPNLTTQPQCDISAQSKKPLLWGGWQSYVFLWLPVSLWSIFLTTG